MFVTIRRYTVKGSMQEVSSRVQKGLVPLLSKQPGFVSYHAADAGNNVAFSVSVYQNHAAADAANKAAAGWVQQNLGALLGNVELTMGEVTASSEHARPTSAVS
jgi:hypothetical protein